MKKFILLGMAVLFGSFLLSASVQATPVLSPYVENEIHYQGFSNLEDSDGDGHASAGEELWAIERVTLIDWAGGFWQPNLAVEELTSVMEDVFFSSTYSHPLLKYAGLDGTGHHFYYEADDVTFDVNNDQGLGDASLKAYYDTTSDWDSTLKPGERPGSPDSAYLRATDGNLWLDLDVIHYQGHFDQLDIWFASIDGSGNPVGAPVFFDGGEGHMWGLLDLVNDYTGYGWILDSYTKYADTNSSGGGDTMLTGDFYLICDLDPMITAAHVGWEYGTNNPLKGVPTPEPATMLLLGSGLIGLAGFARKKFKK